MMEKIVKVKEREFILSSDGDYKSVEITALEDFGGAKQYLIKVCGKDKKPLTLKWKKHMVGVLSFWSPTCDRNRFVKQWFRPRKNESNFYYGAPVISVIDDGGINFTTVALSDAVNSTEQTFCVNDFEEKENLDFSVTLFFSQKDEDYQTVLYIDESKTPFYSAIPTVRRWWGGFYPLDKARTVNGEYPLYSSWYNFHQNPVGERLLEELSLAAKVGFKSVIIDDGWSYDGLGTSDYFDCGDWKFSKEKFPDFKAFTDKVHSFGMKVAVWFPVPFVGYNNPDFIKYKDRMLYLDDNFRTGILDPRYKSVRDYIVDGYVRIVNQTGIDGLKLDFIDSFRCENPSLLIKEENKAKGRDFDNVEDAVVELLNQIELAVNKDKDDFMIEFRQFYVGPAITRYSNMLRVADCAFDTVTNRVGVIDLRLLNYDLAVHADMLYWAKDEIKENCAKMLLNIAFGVPQISVLLKESSSEQIKLLKNYIGYWYENKDIILHGEFIAKKPELLYTYASAENSDKRIAVCYAESVYEFDGKSADVFNATENKWLYIDSKKGGNATVYDCLGEKVAEMILNETKVVKVRVPVGGRVDIR